MEEMDRRGDRFNKAIADSLRLAEERSKEIVEKAKADLSASYQRFKDFLVEIREYHDEQKKYYEEKFDRRLEREREIEAFEEALDSETYDIKIEKSRSKLIKILLQSRYTFILHLEYVLCMNIILPCIVRIDQSDCSVRGSLL